MIELLWQDKSDFKKAFILLNEVLLWLSKTLAEHEEYNDIVVNGYLVARDDLKNHLSTLILCEEESQKRLLKILQQPPEEFKERYVPCILSAEPDSVEESPKCSGDDDDEEEIGSEIT